jgi:excisionase family DNA binding protein
VEDSVNLKQAALRLGVHYQTAYRWVRSGELVAVKVGTRYEVSEASLERFVNRRAELVAERSVEPSAAASPLARADGDLAELRALVARTRATAQPCFDAAVVLAGSRLGDAAVLRLVDEDSGLLEAVASFAASPDDRAAVVGGIAVAGGFSRSAAPWSSVEASGEVHVVHHMPRDLIRGLFGEEGRFAGRGVEVLAAAVAPMSIQGEFVGGLLTVKTRSHEPFGDGEIGVLREVAALCSEAHHRAGAFGRTWRSNTALRERVAALIRSDLVGGTDLAGRLDPGRAQALVSPDGRVLVATEAFRAVQAERLGEGFLGRWDASGMGDVIVGVVEQVDLEPVEGGGPGVIVSGVRADDAELLMLAVEVIEY